MQPSLQTRGHLKSRESFPNVFIGNLKIAIPANIERETALKKGQLVELKVVGGGKPKSIVITARENAR